MARLQEYKRSLDAVVTIHSAAFLSKTTDEILRQIKQEPDTEHDETIYDTCTSMKDQLEENLSNNEYGNKSSNENIVSYQTENAITSIDDRVKKNSTLSNVMTQICWNQLREKNNVDPKNGKRKRSQGRDDIKSSKRFKKDLKISKEKTGDVKCKTCFVSFKTKLALQNHLIWFKKQGSYTNKDSSSTLQKYTCNFCQCKFSKKKIVQGHLFHSHQKEIEHNSAQSISTKGALNSHYNSLIKDKMRQTTLTEFMSSGNHLKHTEMQTPSNNTDFSSQIVIKQEIDINDELSNPSTNTSLSQTSVQNEHRRESIMTNKPFVQIHVDPSMMEALLGIPYKQNDLAELLENNRNKVYNLRSLKSNKVNEKHKKNINYKLKVKNLLRMCKRCSIPLTKCDDKSIVGSTAQFSTPLTGILRQNNHSSLKQSRRYREKRNVKFVTKTSPQESSSANSTPNLSIPISASSSSSSSKVKELEKDEIKSPRKSLTNRRSLNENTVTCKRSVKGTRKKRSLEKNVENSEVLPFQDNSNLTPVQSSQPRKDFKLKDLRVSLIKLPMIKKELDTPNETVRSNEIFNCTVCEIPFSSEKKRNRHIKKYHTACISSICTARCRSKSFMLNHYLQKHIIWKWNKCCVCRQFCTSRVSLKQHLLLHCIKTVLTKNEKRPSNYIRSCVPINMTRRRKRSQLRSIQLEQISNVEQDNLTVETVKYNVDNIVSQIEEFQQPQQPQQSQQFQQPQQPQQSQQFQQPQQPQQFQQPQQPQQLQQSQQPQQLQQSQQPQQPQQSQQLQQLQQNDEEAQRILNDKQETQIAIEEMQKSLEDNTVIYLSPNYEVIPMDREPEVDPLCIINNISTPDCSRETQITLMSSPKTVRPSIDKPNVTSVISNITPNSIKQKYPCPVCRKQFQKLESLWQHKRTYTQSFQHCCTICGMCFSNRKILRNHVNTTHNRLVCNLYKLHCQFCNQGFRTQNNLQIHELHYHATTETADKQKITELLQVFNSETNDNTFQTLCNVCGLLFNNYERYQLHTMYFHTAPTFPCNYCNRVFQGLYMLHHHNKLYHYPESIKSAYKYRCPICLEGFTIETHLHGHLCHVHTEERHEATSNVDLTSSACYDSTTKRYVCTKCRQEFTTVAKLMKHVERYLDDGNYLCERCPRRCSTLALLHEHVQLSHNNILRNAYKCDMCEEVLLSSSSLYSHQKHFHYYLENSGSLEIAERTPNENVKEGEVEATTNDTTLSTEIEKPEEKLVALHEPIVVIDTSTSATIVASKCNIFCPICGVKFEKDTYLKQHLAEFLDIGDYKCNECQRRFANNELLQKHLSSHITPGMLRSKYHCSLCNENFQSAIVYESHVAHIHAQVFFKDVSTVDV